MQIIHLYFFKMSSVVLPVLSLPFLNNSVPKSLGGTKRAKCPHWMGDVGWGAHHLGRVGFQSLTGVRKVPMWVNSVVRGKEQSAQESTQEGMLVQVVEAQAELLWSL